MQTAKSQLAAADALRLLAPGSPRCGLTHVASLRGQRGKYRAYTGGGGKKVCWGFLLSNNCQRQAEKGPLRRFEKGPPWTWRGTVGGAGGGAPACCGALLRVIGRSSS